MIHPSHCRPSARFPAAFVFGLLLLACLSGSPALAQSDESYRPDPGMLQYPDVSQERIVFVYANDLWTVAREGGQAVPLASPPGQERFPKFSPDGGTIAFMGNYDGDLDLYTIPVEGGVPHRVTYHPTGETLNGWTPDGRLLYSAGGVEGLGPMPKLYTVAVEGGLPEAIPVPYGAVGAVSMDGIWLAYTPHTRDTRTWKRYRGGMATDIWLFNLDNHESRKITDWEGTDTLPMWHGKKVFYLSDNGPEAKLNIWVYDVERGEREQVTRFTEFDVKWPSIGPGDRGQGEIVFQKGDGIFLLDLEHLTSREIKVTIPGALPTVRDRQVDGEKFIQSWGISPTGKRAVVQARGDVWTLPAEHGAPRNLTRTSGVAERTPSWSPDGRWIAYFSDATDEYELYITQSDGKGETRQLTEGSTGFYEGISWSPDSKHVAFTDNASRIHLHTITSGETRLVDQDPWGNRLRVSWSHDSRWITYQRTTEEKPLPVIYVYNVEDNEKHPLTSGMFPDASPTFDRKGDYLYFVSNRSFTPTYGDVDTTWVYRETQVVMAAPLRTDIDNPWLPESDEEKWDDEKKEDREKKEGEEKGEEKKGDEDKGEEEPGEEEAPAESAEAAAPADDVTGTWEGTAVTPEGDMPFTCHLKLNKDHSVTGTISSAMFSGDVTGSYDPGEKSLTLTFTIEGGPTVLMELKIENGTMTGTGTTGDDTIPITASRTGEEAPEGKKDQDKKKDEPREKVEIALEGFEGRAFQVPVPKGNFGGLAVNDKNQLIYSRRDKGIMLFDLKDKKKEEKTVAAGAQRFTISADGKKLLVVTGSSASIQDASAGGKGKKVVTAGMNLFINPRKEWKQIFTDAWRIQRDFFYVDNTHGVDWNAVRARYGKMLESCVTREDVSFVIREMISELNVGHAYYFGGDGESAPSVSVGMLGVDFELDGGAYRIVKIHEGAPWDVDARSPLRMPGVNVKEGDYLLAVNAVAVDTARDPWAAFVGLSDQTITLTVSENPEPDEKARDVVVKTIRSERNLRYRAWIESNRACVEEKTGGQVGYIYVPNTGVDGQNDLVRQFVGQIGKKALIVDERWNGGGQVPTRFIELLNRPVTNYWARRHGKESVWPPDAHHGPKCMLINGLAGSGGDMFPFLFRQAGLGKLIGTRTWGGLVGLSGNPGLIDGGFTAVPTFGFYEKDGTWGIEGHGVDPDVEVVDDPALMVDGGDPQLDTAIQLMLEEIKRNPYVPAKRPPAPDRSGMGLKEEDK